ncbi:glycoside hydrolase family 16 protein [Pseudonocardia sp. C8]|uniref:glycoside hydrolase family 16 protein n=1 Tax=Pseudonocardia sp. C8 TaxID=2762759 RepID=UPI0016436251|nr:glycoside hydrolase family 16 protein [Pseudonocardia sp. C8]MBC3189522.1 glycoside hydrolase family 16 protein [Pseudonocardia sp. C8]
MSTALLARLGWVLTLSSTLAAFGVAPTAPPDNVDCGFRITAVHVLAEMTGDTSPRAERIRRALIDAGANEPGFVPESCYDTGSGGGGSPGSAGGGGQGTGAGGDQSDSGSGSDQPGNGGGGSGGDQDGSGPASPAGSDSGTNSSQQGQTAAEAFGWGEPAKVDDFENGLEGWNLYDGPGHGGNGTRSPDAASVSDGILTINGTGDGTTAGMAWADSSQQYGRWEVRMKAPTGSPSYNALALLWPTAENFPVGGEVDFAEIMDPDRKKVELFLHYGADNSQVHGEVEVDATEWHNYAVEWTPEAMTAFVDGREWWKSEDTSIFPPGPMHLTLQLDWFPKGDSETGQVHYDWVRMWPLGEGEGASTGSAGSAGSTDADSSTTITDEVNNWGGRMHGIR